MSGFSRSTAWTLLATTGPGGFVMGNTTPTILSWTAPGDGNLHRVICPNQLMVSSTQTGGAISLVGSNSSQASAVWAGSQSGPATYHGFAKAFAMFTILQPGETISWVQETGLSAGASTFFAEFWGS